MNTFIYIETDNVGVNNKIRNQINAFNKLGVNTVGLALKKKPLLSRLIPFQTSSADWKRVDVKNADSLFIRYPFFDYKFICFLKKYKKTKNGKVIIEIPTYPYDGENYRNKIIVARDHIYRRLLKKYVDYIVFEGEEAYSTIFGIPALRINNGIDVESLPVKKTKLHNNEIRLLCVASFYPEYGMDRVIHGLHTYYSREKNDYLITLHLVGRGPELKKYKEIAYQFGISDKVIMHGFRTGIKLDKIFDKSDIGLDAIAIHRKGLKVSSTLKTREYMARGLPFIYSAIMPGLSKEMQEYTLFFDPGDSEISMDKVIAFYERIYKQGNVAERIRSLALKSIDMMVVLKPVAGLLK